MIINYIDMLQYTSWDTRIRLYVSSHQSNISATLIVSARFQDIDYRSGAGRQVKMKVAPPPQLAKVNDSGIRECRSDRLPAVGSDSLPARGLRNAYFNSLNSWSGSGISLHADNYK